MAVLFTHPRLGRVRLVQQYSDMCVVAVESNGEFETVVPQVLTPISEPARAALPEVIDVSVTDVTRIRVGINTCSPQELADAVDGIGRARAAKILSRKPEGGYQDYAQLESLNPDVGLNWVDVQTQDVIDFEAI